MGATGTSVSRALIVLVTLVHAGCSSGADTPDSPAAPTTGSPSSSSPAATREATDAATPWTGPVRTDAVLPVISRRRARSWTDPRDTAPAEIDIRSVDSGASDVGGGEWQFRLAARPPLDPARRTVAYGVVVDGDGDHQADCQIGVDNDASRMGELRAWVTNLRTDETEVEDGGPYGDPIEFAHPAERGSQRLGPPRMTFDFLGHDQEPCDAFGDSATFYVWSSLTEAGEVTAWDHAPDAAWLPMRCGSC